MAASSPELSNGDPPAEDEGGGDGGGQFDGGELYTPPELSHGIGSALDRHPLATAASSRGRRTG